MTVTYTEELRQDILGRLEMQAIMCDATRTAPAINILEALALLGEIERLTTRLSISEAWLGRVATSHPVAYLATIERDKE